MFKIDIISTIWLILILIITLSLKLINYYRKNKRYNKLLGLIPGPTANYPLIGNLDLFFKDNSGLNVNRYHSTMTKMVDQYKEQGIFKINLVKIELICIFRADYAEIVLKNSVNIEKPAEYKTLVGDFLGKGLLASDNSLSWKRTRHLVTPGFHFKILNKFSPIINDKANVLVEKLKNLSINQKVDLYPIMAQCTIDIIGEIVFGFDLNTQNNQNLEFLEAVQQINEIPMIRITHPWLLYKSIFYCTKYGREWNKALELLQRFSRRVIEERKQCLIENRKCLDNNQNIIDRQSSLLDLLLNIHLTDNSFSLDNIRDEVNTFVFAGHDSTAICLSWTLYLIGLHPDIQERLYEELSSIVTKDSDITTDQIKRMTYLEAVLMESMRVYPPVHVLGRKVTKEMKLGDYTVPIGATIQLSLSHLNMDQGVFPDPTVFNPDRFLGERNSPFSFVPFSAGPRNCIGKKLAINELKIILSKLLVNFNFESVDKREDLTVIYGMVVKSLNGIRMIITPR